MKGLLIKDFKLMLSQKRFFIMAIVFGLFFMITNGDPASGLGYIMMLSILFTLSTISYDEYDNGMLFLMALPMDRTMYVAEKYVFSGLMLLISTITAFILAILVTIGRNLIFAWKELLMTCVVLMMLFWLMLMITLPAQVKYGAEKGRMVIMLIGGGIFAVFVLLEMGKDYLGIDFGPMLIKLESLDESVFIIIGIVVVMALSTGSYFISKNIIKKKEF